MKFLAPRFAKLGFALVLLAITQGCTSTSTSTKSFASPEDAVTAMITAAEITITPRSNPSSALTPMRFSSGDEVADRNTANTFVEHYDTKHQITPGDNGRMTLVIGDNDWPFPIPLVKDEKDNDWHFDTAAGKEEILNRRIGRNELYTIQVCRAIADAQREYARIDPNGDGVPEYADKFISDPGQKNGLYWKTEDGEPPSPLGAVVADAMSQGYTAARNEKGEANPYHGYHYLMLHSQGPHADGGAHDYMVNGKRIGGFSGVAFPAQYGNSGVMTFIVNQNGDVYQQDLGPDTEKVAKAMTSFDPGPGWEKVADQTPGAN